MYEQAWRCVAPMLVQCIFLIGLSLSSPSSSPLTQSQPFFLLTRATPPQNSTRQYHQRRQTPTFTQVEGGWEGVIAPEDEERALY